MKERIKQWQQLFEAFSLRERGLIFIALVVLGFMAWDTLLLSPQEIKQKKILSEMLSQNQQLENISAQVSSMTEKLRGGEAQHVQARISELRQLLSGLKRKQKDLTVEFIRPEQMATVLRDMLSNENSLKLIRLESLGVKPLFPAPEVVIAGTSPSLSPSEHIGKNILTSKNNKITVKKSITKAKAGHSSIYKHGMRVEFEGNFNGTVAYLQALESMPWRFYWDNVEYEVLQFPLARVVITVHTLSLDEDWIGV